MPRYKKKMTPREEVLAKRKKKYTRGVPKKKMKVKKAKRQAREDVAGSYLTTRGKKQRILDRAFDYTME